LFMARTKKIGILKPEVALQYGVTGPMLRASGISHDLRKAQPYSGYEQYDFIVPTRTEGDTYARYLVRLEEMRQSLRIVEQGLDKLPLGPVRSNNRKYVPPPRSEIGVSMEALIHHFKLGRRDSARPGVRCMWGSSRHAASLGCIWRATEAPSRIGCTGVRLPSQTCKSCLSWRRDTWWLTWWF